MKDILKKGLTAILSICSLTILAAPRTPQQAAEAMQAHSATSRFSSPKRTGGSPRLVHTRTNTSTLPLLYVFDHGNDEGFTLISGDDRLPEILGYTEHGRFENDNLPPALAWWIDQYAAQTASLYAADEASKTGSVRVARDVETPRATIQPLVAARWDQGYPYNSLCPVKDSQRCVTGCSATALAQIIHHHKYMNPKVGSITSEYDGTEFDFNQYTFDWSSMRDTYKKDAFSDTEAKAVGTLMLACGVAQHMMYSPAESGAITDFAVPYALTEYFGYDKGVRTISRSTLPTSTWKNTIYAELSASRPVLYTGQSDGGGHAFVCDGYTSYADLDYYHMNWGWSGYGDGWFRISALDPIDRGIGAGSGGGYNYNQSMIVGIRPPVADDTSTYDRSLFLYPSGEYYRGFCTSNESTTASSKIDLHYNKVYSQYPKALNANFGAIIFGADPSNEDMTPIIVTQNQTLSLPPCSFEGSYGVANIQASIHLPDSVSQNPGKYLMLPAVCIQDEKWKILTQEFKYTSAVTIDVISPQEIYLSNSVSIYRENVNLSLTMKVSGIFLPGFTPLIEADLTNNADYDYNDKLYTIVFPKDANTETIDEMLFYSSCPVDLAGGESMRLNLPLTIAPDCSAGKYAIRIFSRHYNEYGTSVFTPCSETVYATIEEPLPSTGSVKFYGKTTKVYQGDGFPECYIFNGTSEPYTPPTIYFTASRAGIRYKSKNTISELQPGCGATITLNMSNPAFFTPGQYEVCIAKLDDNGEIKNMFDPWTLDYYGWWEEEGLFMGLNASESEATIAYAGTLPGVVDGHYTLPSEFTTIVPSSYDASTGTLNTKEITVPVSSIAPSAFSAKRHDFTDLHIPASLCNAAMFSDATQIRRYWMEREDGYEFSETAFPSDLSGVEIYVPYSGYSSCYDALSRAGYLNSNAPKIYSRSARYSVLNPSNDELLVGQPYSFYVVADTPKPYCFNPDITVTCDDPDACTITCHSADFSTTQGIEVNIVPHIAGVINLRITPAQWGAEGDTISLIANNTTAANSLPSDTPIEVFTIDGLLLHTMTSIKDLDMLPTGLYIVRTSTTTHLLRR